MEIVTKQVDLNNNRSSIVIAHNGEEIPWSVAFLDSATRRRKTIFEAGGDKPSDPYELINEYWKTQPKDVQDRIFQTYSEIKDVFGSVFEFEGLTLQLFPLIKQLFSLHDMRDVKYWVDFKSPIRMPTNDPNLTAEYDVTNSPKKPKEGTYTMPDYNLLVVMSVAIRIMLPVWGDYIDRVADDVGTNMKEYRAYRLLAKSDIYESVPMEKLREYVRFNTRPDIVKTSAIYKGISSEEFPEWMLGLVVVRKLGCLDVDGVDNSVSTVKTLFNYIGHKLKNHENSFNGTISEKVFEGTKNTEGENNLSTMEGYRNPEDIALGTSARFQVYMREVTNQATRICPDIPDDIVKKSLKSVHKNFTGIPDPVQIQIVQIVLNVNKTLVARAHSYLDHHEIRNAMAIAQACLWWRGHKELAALVAARIDDSVTEIMTDGGDHRARIPPEMLEELAKYYPYARRPTARTKKEDQPNVARVQIEKMEKMLSSRNWILTLPNDWVAEIAKNENTRRYFVPSNIKIKLAELTIATAKRSF